MANLKTLLIPIIEKVLIQEIGEANIVPLKWTKTGPSSYKFLVDIGDYTEVVSVLFEHFHNEEVKGYYIPPKYHHLKNLYNVGYDISGNQYQFAKSDMKTLLKILSTVVSIVEDFVNSREVDGLFIQGNATSPGGNSITKKSNIYKAFIERQLNQITNFGSDTHRDGFILVKTN